MNRSTYSLTLRGDCDRIVVELNGKSIQDIKARAKDIMIDYCRRAYNINVLSVGKWRKSVVPAGDKCIDIHSASVTFFASEFRRDIEIPFTLI